MNFSIGYNSDKGLKRTKNEDSYAVLNRTQLSGKLDGLLVVADGMGGLRGGEIASKTVVETIPHAVIETLAQRNGSGTPLDVKTLLRDTIIRANGKIWTMRRFDGNPETKGMGTTCVAAIVQENLLTVANVGDSRAYLLRDGRLTLLTDDHSEVFEQVQRGEMTMEQASKSQFRNIVTRGVGLGQEVNPDITTHPIQEGDTILLCTDGLTTEVPDSHIATLLSQDEDAQNASDRLVKAALRHGGRDNVTVVVMRYGTFVPSARALILPDTEEDEPDTDPNQEWRRRSPLDSDEEFDEDEDDMDYPPQAPAPRARESRTIRRRPPLFSTVAQVVIMLLALACLAEGAMLYNAMKNPPKSSDAASQPAPEKRLTDTPLDYGALTTLSTKTLQDDYLEVDPKGNAFVVTINGNLMRISPDGKEMLLPSLFDTNGVKMADKQTAPKAVTHPDIALDASSNLYFISKDLKRILKFDSKGVRLSSGLPESGKGELTAPTRIAVDNQTGTLYILDNHHLKMIKATSPVNK